MRDYKKVLQFNVLSTMVGHTVITIPNKIILRTSFSMIFTMLQGKIWRGKGDMLDPYQPPRPPFPYFPKFPSPHFYFLTKIAQNIIVKVSLSSIPLFNKM